MVGRHHIQIEASRELSTDQLATLTSLARGYFDQLPKVGETAPHGEAVMTIQRGLGETIKTMRGSHGAHQILSIVETDAQGIAIPHTHVEAPTTLRQKLASA